MLVFPHICNLRTPTRSFRCSVHLFQKKQKKKKKKRKVKITSWAQIYYFTSMHEIFEGTILFLLLIQALLLSEWFSPMPTVSIFCVILCEWWLKMCSCLAFQFFSVGFVVSVVSSVKYSCSISCYLRCISDLTGLNILPVVDVQWHDLYIPQV